MSFLTAAVSRMNRTPSARFIQRFHQDETGGMTVFTMFILVLMLILAGMAVDFMRFESRRTIMQGAVDRAVLAAADLDQQGDPDAIVRDYVAKSQGANCLDGDPIIAEGDSFRSVTANCELVLNTFFLKLLGVKELTAQASATAIEGVGNVEVSLVVDISGSMASEVPGAGVSRMERLKEAATAFVDTLLIVDHEDKISVSLVPYTTGVNAGPELFDALGVARKHWFSDCVNFRDTDFETAAWPNGLSATIEDTNEPGFADVNRFEQGQHATYNDWNQGTCPTEDYEQIIPISQDRDVLNAAIGQLQPRASTAIFLGLKWATALLDPSVRDAYANLPGSMRDSAFVGRPADHGTAGDLGGTLKYIVVMTDGQNWDIYNLDDHYYDTASKIAHMGDQTFLEHYYSNLGRQWLYYTYYQMKYPRTQGDAFMESICDAAKDQEIIIYAIAMGAPTHGEEQMRKCASSDSHFYTTSGSELVQIFEDIAEQITDLRLTL